VSKYLFRLTRALVLVGLTGFALLESREYLISHLGRAVFQLLLVPVLLVAIWLGMADWIAETRAKKKQQLS